MKTAVTTKPVERAVAYSKSLRKRDDMKPNFDPHCDDCKEYNANGIIIRVACNKHFGVRGSDPQ